MKARKKAGVIEVERYFSRSLQSWPPHVRFGARAEGQPATVWNEPQQAWIPVHDGDYIRIDLPNDVYPINAEYFAANFDVVEG